MHNKALIVVSLNVDIEKEAEFNDFYHHDYIPHIMKVIPELRTARRYQEHNVADSLRYYTKEFLTFYECATLESAQKAWESLQNHPYKEQWKKWQDTHLHNLERATIYTLQYEHPRIPVDGHFSGRPFFMVTVEGDPERLKEFDRWYEERYLPKNVADVPTWTACRRYKSQGRTPAKYLTIYEAEDPEGLHHSLELMRAPHRLQENASWKQWDSGENPVIIKENAASFIPIYRYPN